MQHFSFHKYLVFKNIFADVFDANHKVRISNKGSSLNFAIKLSFMVESKFGKIFRIMYFHPNKRILAQRTKNFLFVYVFFTSKQKLTSYV